MLSWLTRIIERTPPLHRAAVTIWRLLPARVAGFLKGLMTRSWVVGVVGVLIDASGSTSEVLIADHSYRKKGRWGLPGGSLESILGDPTNPSTEPSPDDVIEVALRREISEELGIPINIDRLLRIDAIPFMPEEPGPFRLTFYFQCTPQAGFPALKDSLISGDTRPQSPEILDMRLVQLCELDQYDLFSTDHRFLTDDLPRLLPSVSG